MAKTRFYEATLQSTRPWGCYILTDTGATRSAINSLGQRLPPSSKLLIAETGGKLTIIGRRLLNG